MDFYVLNDYDPAQHPHRPFRRVTAADITDEMIDRALAAFSMASVEMSDDHDYMREAIAAALALDDQQAGG